MNMLNNDKVDPRLVVLLDELKFAPERNPGMAARGRSRFLAEAVSMHDKQRHSLCTIFQQKEQLAMKLIVSILVIVGLLFGGNATVAAAQNDLPNEPLYQLKLMSEDVNLWFVSDPVQHVETLMQQAQTRMEEMKSLVSQGVTPPAEVAVRAQERIQRALQIAESLDEPTQTTLLQQIQTRLQTQDQLMDHLQQGTCTACAAVLQQTREMLQIRLGQVERDLANPGNMQNQNQQQNQKQNQNQIQSTQTPQPTGAIAPTQQGTRTPVLDATGQQNGSDNLSAGTPMQQNNNTKQNGDGSQNGTGSGGGNNPSPGGGGQGGKP
jgi:hypothetical protein